MAKKYTVLLLPKRCQLDESHFFVYCPGSSGLFWSSEWRRPSHAKSGEGASEWTSQTGKTFSRSKQNEADWTMDISMMQNPTIQTWSEKFPRGWIIIIRTEIIRFLTLVVTPFDQSSSYHIRKLFMTKYSDPDKYYPPSTNLWEAYQLSDCSLDLLTIEKTTELTAM